MSTLEQPMVAEQLAWLQRFAPRRFLRNGHVQTIAGNFLPRTHPGLPAPEERVIEVEAATPERAASHVLCHCHWQPAEVRDQRTTLILLHGLEGSSQSQYVIGNSARAWEAGLNVVRMNMRNCGGTEKLSPTLYHSGYSRDVAVVMETFAQEYGCEAFALAGYSMGGNLVLKLAGELGASVPHYLKAVVGVSPAMDLAASADALHALEPRLRMEVSAWTFEALRAQG
jgi:predicted alpha/beta-fold hydrolase